MIFTKKRKNKCIQEALKHLELNLIERRHVDIRFRPISDIDDFQEGLELLIEYKDFYYKGTVNSLLIPLNKNLIYNEESFVNYIYNSIYTGIYKKCLKDDKITVHYHIKHERNDFLTINFLIVINDELVFLLPVEENNYYKVSEKKLIRTSKK